MTETVTLEPVPFTVTRYRCPLCARSRSAKKATAEHIARCWQNPATRACKTCEHFTDVPDEGPCIPGQGCACNQGYQQCEAGVADVAAGRIMTGCPLWKLREGEDG